MVSYFFIHTLYTESFCDIKGNLLGFFTEPLENLNNKLRLQYKMISKL